MIQENEIPKYLKSTESDISKSNRKSKHKHQYEECLIQYESTFAGKNYLNTGLYTYCTICGKINERVKGNKSIVTSLPASDVSDWAKASTKPTYTKTEVGLGNVDNTADADKSVK